MRSSFALALLSLIVLLFAPTPAEAFCGFYVAGADTKMFNDATMVVLMRQGRRTVLSMQNTYAGPPEDFAMVVPVPVVLEEEDVKILPRSIFDRVDRLASPRLVEYWEQDPCAYKKHKRKRSPNKAMADGVAGGVPGGAPADFGVRVESEFEVGEYEVVVLSAQDSTGLDAWLRHENYAIPAKAEALLRPYVQQGHKFFVAKVDASKVKFVDGRVSLSPLRVHYDSDTFSLPIRLGLINAGKSQDLIVHILADDRYEVANYPNVAIPTNIEVKNGVRKRFGSFYAALFDATLREHPGAVVTEYSWMARTCDPCPDRPLSTNELITLGGDVLPQQVSPNITLTRLHARYGKRSLGNDLVFQVAPPIVGGRERVVDDQGRLERGAVPDRNNNFQARYIIRHYWKGEVSCQNPRRRRWGGPWPGVDSKVGRGGGASELAQDLAFVNRKLKLDNYVRQKDEGRLDVELLSKGDASIVPPPVPSDPVPAPTPAPEPEPVPEPEPTPEPQLESAALGSDPDPDPPDAIDDTAPAPAEADGCAHCSTPEGATKWSGLLLLGLAGLAHFGLRRRSCSDG
ncbi:hypothetical protein PPSIR1_15415 [Plesiocystis pacifica SIR-1]|uniref:DUF2330 domain-containing protein n=1 Tax=Plesiocystis pacifica SIR-1 TaxID=391625 RepID=A6GK50_9BACT|nr:DUF2330 domain-containing protein [Plesiocystis pacifica]EDM73749.1 hypothetical protein PPSIR1_15415 [Plesiocystis pacifica SIR-1]